MQAMQTIELKRIGVLSYALMVGITVALFMVIAAVVGGIAFAFIEGLKAIVVFFAILLVGLIYAVSGFAFGAVASLVYNLLVNKVGAIRVDVEGDIMKSVRLKKIHAWSLVKIYTIFTAIIGFFVGLVFALLAQMFAAFSSLEGAQVDPVTTWMFNAGWAGLILFPLLYGIMGALSAWVGAGIYNLIASRVGGVQFDLEAQKSR